MVEYNKLNDNLTDTKLKILKTAVKNKRGTTLRMSLKTLDGNEVPHELTIQKKLQDKNKSQKIYLITICQLKLNFLKIKCLKWFNSEDF